MTESLGALAALLAIGRGAGELSAFHDRWADERLVMDKWFALQVAQAAPEKAAAVAEALTGHPAFDWGVPNRFRSVFTALAGNQAGFHHGSGAGYRVLADAVIRIDKTNQMVAARLSGAFETWARWDKGRQAMMRAELARIAGAPGLSRDTGEMVARLLG
jgi:aminopeptidase N